MQKKLTLFSLCIFLSSFYSCNSVKEYEKSMINDPEMGLSSKPNERFETNFETYREAASGANGGKSGGGCGCN